MRPTSVTVTTGNFFPRGFCSLVIHSHVLIWGDQAGYAGKKTHPPQSRKKRIAFKRYKNEEIEVRTYVYSNSLKNVNYTPPQVVLSNTTQME